MIHGNKYDESKVVKIEMEVKNNEQGKKLIISVIDQGQGMDISEYSRFNQSRRKLFNIIDKTKILKQENEQFSHLKSYNDLLLELNTFKLEYYTDYNTFRQLEDSEVTGGVGLLQVINTFDNVEFQNIIKSDEIVGFKVIMEKNV